MEPAIAFKFGVSLILIAYVFFGWLINLNHRTELKRLEKRLDSDLVEHLRVRTVEQYNYQESTLIRQKYSYYTQFWLATIAVLLMGIFDYTT